MPKWAFAGLVLTSAAVLCGQTAAFQQGTVYPAGKGAFWTVAADLNGDGKIDLAVANAGASSVSVFPGDGAGKFGSALVYAAGFEATYVAAGDFLKDGRTDLLLMGETASKVAVLPQRSDGTLGPPVITALPPLVEALGNLLEGVFASSITEADIDGDGKLDVLFVGGDLGGEGGGGAYLLRGNADGTFQTPVLINSGGGVPLAVAVGDFNGDGKTDIAEVTAEFDFVFAQTKLAILTSNGNGFIAGQTVALDDGFNVAAGDLNGDGKLDLVTYGTQISSVPSGAERGEFEAFLGNGDGTFTKSFTGFLPSTIASMAISDVRGTGKPDLIADEVAGIVGLGVPTGSVDVVPSAGDGTFGPATTVTVPNGILSFAIDAADFNADGRIDLALVAMPTSMIGGFDNEDDLPFTQIFPQWVERLPAGNVTVLLNATAATAANVNAASFASGPVAPDSFVTAGGADLANTTLVTEAIPYPAKLGGTTVVVTDAAGVSRAAGIYFVSQHQVNYVIPAGTAPGTAVVTITSGDGTVSSGKITIAAVGPGLFLFSGTNLAAANVVRVNGGGAQTLEDVFAPGPNGTLVAASIDLGPETDQVFLVLYGTGIRGRSSLDAVSVTAGGVPLPVLYAGPQPQFPALDQVNVKLTRDLAGKGDVVIQLSADGKAANLAHVTVR